MICKVIIINSDDKDWRKAVKNAIYQDRLLYPQKYYNVTFKRFFNNQYIISELKGNVNIQVETFLAEISNAESMIITVNSLVNAFDKEKGMLCKNKFVYVVVVN